MSLGVAKTLNIFLFFSVIDRKIACHVLASYVNVDKSLAVFQVFLLAFFPQNNGSRFKKAGPFYEYHYTKRRFTVSASQNNAFLA